MSATELFPIPAAAVAGSAPIETRSCFEQNNISRNGYTLKYFSHTQFKAIELLCDAIIPADDECGGACQAGAAEFVDTAAKGNRTMQIRLAGGLAWLDAFCKKTNGCI